MLAGDRKSDAQQARLVVSLLEDEVIMNDKLVESLGVELVAVGRGLWCSTNDPVKMKRFSLPGERW